MISWLWLIPIAAVFALGGFLLCSLFIAKGRDDK